jgi:hypothetical protein
VLPVSTIAEAFKSISPSPALGARPVSLNATLEPFTTSQPLHAAAKATIPSAPILGVGHLSIPTAGQPSTAIGQPASFNNNGGGQFYTLNDGTFFSMGGNLPNQFEDKSGNTVLSCRHCWGFKGHRLC